MKNEKQRTVINWAKWKASMIKKEQPIGHNTVVQNDALSIKEILQRSIEGNIPPVIQDGQYDNLDWDNPITNLRKPDVDLSDIMRESERAQEIISSAKRIKNVKNVSEETKVIENEPIVKRGEAKRSNRLKKGEIESDEVSDE